MNVQPCQSTLDADDPWTSNLRSLRLEELVDASRTPGPWPPGLPGPTAHESRLLAQAARVVAQVDDVAITIVLRSAPRVTQAGQNLCAAIGPSTELAALAARRLRRLTLSPWFAGPDQDPTLAPAVKEALTSLLARLDHTRSRSAGESQKASAQPHGAPAALAGTGIVGPRLSAREQQVARYVSLGMTNKQIAIALKLSPNTIKRHLARILRRLGMGKRAALASWYAVQPRPGEPTPMGGEPTTPFATPTPRGPAPCLPKPAGVDRLLNAPLHQ